MGYIGALLEGGLKPSEIAFVSFTKAAINEARKRVSNQYFVAGDDLRYFGTLHSMAYRSLALSRTQVVGGKKWGEFCRSVDLRYSSSDGIPDDDLLEPIGNEEGDILRRFHDWRRSCELEMESALKQFDPGPFDGWSRARAIWFTRVFEEWKTAEGLYDFCDFLTELAASGWHPPVRVLIVDESQDLSPIQRRIVLAWAQEIGNLLLAYDPNQTIFEFQGADPRWLLDLAGTREFLNQSFRVPKRPAKISQRIINRNSIRYDNEWAGTDAPGDVRFDADFDQTIRACAADDETWYFLARNRYFLARYSDALMDAGVPFVNLRGHTPRPGMGTVCAYRLAQGEQVRLADFAHFAEDTPQKDWWERGAKADLARRAAETPEACITREQVGEFGARAPLHNCLASANTCTVPLKTAEEKKRFHLRVYQRLGLDGLTRPPRVTVSTIHGVKGGEARNVVIDPQMTRRTAEGFDSDPESERRVWYVGASRTQNRLIVLDPARSAFYDEW
jgi:superfamily I DNA/RNA helicase